MTDEIGAPAIDGAMTAGNTPATPDTPTEPVAFDRNPAVDEALRATWDRLHPTRGDNGQFAARDQQAPDTPSEGDKPADQPAEGQAQEQAKAPAIDAPASWSAEQKARWANFSPEDQAYIAKREKDAHDAISRAGQQIKAYEPVGQVFEQFKDVYEKYQMPPHVAVAHLFAAERSLSENPTAALKELAKAYGVDPLDLMDGQQPNQQQPSPEAAEVRALKAELAQIKSKLSAQDKQAHEASLSALNREIAEFAKDKPHFDALFDDITDQVAAIKHRHPDLSPKEVLNQAYERAIKVNPTVSAAIAAEKAAADKKARDDEAARKTSEAKRAASVNTKSSIGHPGGNPKSMDDTLKEIAARHYG